CHRHPAEPAQRRSAGIRTRGDLMIEAIKSGAAAPAEKPQKLEKATKDFEALLIAQLLKGMREEEGGWMGTGTDQASGSAMALAEEQLARSLADNGGLGLGRLIISGIRPTASTPASPNLPSAPSTPPPDTP